MGELELLRTLMPSAQGEGRRIVLLTGEPGAGKTRLTREFAAEMGSLAIRMRGACDAVVRTPYGPFAEALGDLVEALDDEELASAFEPGGGELTRLLPGLASRVDRPQPREDADPDTERHRLHTAVASLLTRVGAESPVLLVLEDCHWADAPSLLLLRHLARGAEGARLLVLATFRDSEADLSPEAHDALADLHRSDDVVRMHLEGLTDAEVGDLVRRAAGGDEGDGELATTIHRLTGGNPFLVCELWRALLETETVTTTSGALRVRRPVSELATPESVREVVSQRLARLGEETNDLLGLAATAGPEFALDPIRRASGLAEPKLLAALEEAVASGMIEELSSQPLAYGFTHELVRRALYDRLPGTRRAELHLRVGEALEASAAGSDRDAADLAHHFGSAAPFGDLERAVEYNVAAARAAAAALDFDAAADRLRTALRIGIEDEARRAGALLTLGTVYNRAGKAVDALEALAAVAEIARRRGSSELLARAAIGYEEACWRPGLSREQAVELLGEALDELGGDEDQLRVYLLAGMARSLSSLGRHERAALARDSAIEIARGLDDRAGLARVLVRSYWARGKTPLEEILAMLGEARDLGAELGDAEVATEAMAWRVPTLVSLFDLDSARAEASAVHTTAERTAQPFMHHVAEQYRSTIALCEGRLGEAEEAAELSREWGELLTGRDASGVYGIQMFGIRREQGRLAELAPAVRILAGDTRRGGPWQPGMIALLAELGMEREAKRELSKLAADGIEVFRPTLWVAALAYLADSCAVLGDQEVAAIVYPELEPLAGTALMTGQMVACHGAADRYLGMLAATLGDHESAEGHLERALELDRRTGWRLWVAHSSYEYGRFLLGRGGREAARELIGEAAGLAKAAEMNGLLAKIERLGLVPGDGGLPDGISPREAQILALVARGLSNREVGEELSISEHTAANHVRSILRKTGCVNRTEAASYAHRHGLAPA